MSVEHYFDVLKHPAPCDDCRNRQICKEELKACKAFVAYVQRGQFWRGERTPTRALWQKIYLEDEDDDFTLSRREYIKKLKEQEKAERKAEREAQQAILVAKRKEKADAREKLFGKKENP